MQIMSILRGNAVIGQSGGPTAAINATLAGVIRGALQARKGGIINTLFGMRNGIEGFLDEKLVNLTEMFENDVEAKLNECDVCGEPTSSNICKACELKIQLQE